MTLVFKLHFLLKFVLQKSCYPEPEQVAGSRSKSDRLHNTDHNLDLYDDHRSSHDHQQKHNHHCDDYYSDFPDQPTHTTITITPTQLYHHHDDDHDQQHYQDTTTTTTTVIKHTITMITTPMIIITINIIINITTTNTTTTSTRTMTTTTGTGYKIIGGVLLTVTYPTKMALR